MRASPNDRFGLNKIFHDKSHIVNPQIERQKTYAIAHGSNETFRQVQQGKAHGYGDDEYPMGRHDVDLVETEAHAHMQQHVEAKP